MLYRVNSPRGGLCRCRPLPARRDKMVIIMKIYLNLASHSYDITVERGALKKASEYLNLDRRVLVVTDSGVPTEFADEICKQCKEAVKAVIPQGDGNKNIANFADVLEKMLDASLTRGDCVVAVGGGVVGDLAGFCASCYMRGIDFYNIPTTLLSQVDSSIGGKTAINFCGVKNVVGSFYQPKAVIIDPETLKTLDRRQFNAGLAEVIKMAATFDAELLEMIEKSTDIDRDIDEIIVRSLCIKRDVVEQDPTEKGLRKVLNFGHTVGHAIEGEAKGKLLHGECVAIGMLPMSAPDVRVRLKAILEKYGLKTEITASKEKLMPFMLHDKKMQGKLLDAVYVEKAGSYVIKKVTAEEILNSL